MGIQTIGTPELWVGFTAFVLLMLVLDLGVFHRKAHKVGVREALIWSAVWIGLALVFNVVVYFFFGAQRALEFAAGYLIEKALSIDNLFVFFVVLSYFRVPDHLQHRVLFWGILGALVMRAGFILAGAALLERFHFVFYVFGFFLVYTGIKMLRQRADDVHPERNPVLRFFRRWSRVVPDYHGAKFLVRHGGKLHATPLFMVLAVIEATDLVFAVDSIPAIFAVTRDPFIVYTSNIFAILGLRALYFALSGIIDRFHYLKVGVGFLLAFVGAKMLIADVYKVPVWFSLALIVTVIALSIVLSLVKPREQQKRLLGHELQEFDEADPDGSNREHPVP